MVVKKETWYSKLFEEYKFDKNEEIELINIEDTLFYKKMVFSNITIDGNSSKNVLRKICDLIGKVEDVAIMPVDGTSNIQVWISKREKQTFKFLDFLSLYEEVAKKGEILLGFSAFNKESIKINEIKNVLIMGAPNSGKTSFLKSFTSQLILNHDVEIGIIDPKGIDLGVFKSHPKVFAYGVSQSDQTSIMQLIALEFAKRREYFNESFEVPPNNLEEYLTYREKYQRDDLPKFKEIFIIIDEARLVAGFEQENEPYLNDSIHSWLNLGRAFGIHFVLCSQTFLSQRLMGVMSHSFVFYSPTLRLFTAAESFQDMECEYGTTKKDLNTIYQPNLTSGECVLFDKVSGLRKRFTSLYLNSEDSLSVVYSANKDFESAIYHKVDCDLLKYFELFNFSLHNSYSSIVSGIALLKNHESILLKYVMREKIEQPQRTGSPRGVVGTDIQSIGFDRCVVGKKVENIPALVVVDLRTKLNGETVDYIKCSYENLEEIIKLNTIQTTYEKASKKFEKEFKDGLKQVQSMDNAQISDLHTLLEESVNELEKKGIIKKVG